MLVLVWKNFKLVVVAVFIGGFASSPVWASDYQAGLSAYIDGNYASAQQYWLTAANANDARSMFNLGLMHERNKLPFSSSDKAANWYRLAAENGYAPAGYHQAQRMLERGGSDDQAIALIQRAADDGYAPARRHLGLSAGFMATGDSRDAQLSDQTESWINQQNSQHWTIQLLAFNQKEQVLAFIQAHRLQRKAAHFTDVSDGEVFYKLVYGSYNSKDKASVARQNLSAALQQHGPWLRTWESVQKVTK
jgi:hypothetical protein